MPETGYSQTAKVHRGALVQLVPDIVGVVPNIVAFQYNPEKITRGLEPWNPFEVDQTKRGAQAPTVQPYDPEESFSFTLEFDAADGLEEGNPLATTTGIAARLAALKKLTLPTKGLLGDLAASAQALFGGPSAQAVRPTVPILLLVLGPGVILPVRITKLSFEQILFSPLLYPLQATATLDLRVLTPEVFKCRVDTPARIAIAAYEFTRLQDDALAIANLAGSLDDIRGVLPF
ncbi:hypothetical protein [Limobrevibacterium gyesilva]|uniref:Uncharacterized protein n=1 Tax=Limobrevibacterium gyesilva TaxID=2991712 RepID=A0AA41YK73_9PROT|nr:hypothetical protein [Limobrevibacterium gyesilva]MCW3475304.1 hypothetical protein [Limobrevibacterium gyesilva]